MLVAPLFEGPIDVVGDVHGELDALRALLDVLGYDADGVHPDGRRLVFVGDLTDRGPDSPGVLALVRGLVDAGRAQGVLGNHELALLRDDSKHGNRWFVDPDHAEQRGEFAASRALAPELKADALRFIGALPLALERADLRVVHAAWHAPTIAALRAFDGDVATAMQHFEDAVEHTLDASGVNARADVELDLHPIEDRDARPPLLAAVGHRDELHQMGNPVRVVTSGIERATTRTFWASGKWRMVERVAWWHDYHDAVPVIFGHYWRNSTAAMSRDKPDLFGGAGATAWLGPRRDAYCVDFSIGGRYWERSRGITPFGTHLAAVRWPERELVFEDGTRARLDPS